MIESQLLAIVKKQYLDNVIAHTIVRCLADCADEKITDQFIFSVLGSAPLLEILEKGQRKSEERLKKMSMETVKIFTAEELGGDFR